MVAAAAGKHTVVGKELVLLQLEVPSSEQDAATGARVFVEMADAEDLEFALQALQKASMPHGRQQLRQELESELMAKRAELAPLSEVYEEVDRRARRVARTFAFASISLFASEWVLVAYGTYAVYSWDIMEPITYLLGLMDCVIAYTFFLTIRADYSPSGLREAVLARARKRQARKLGWDAEKFEAATADVARLERRLRYLRTQELLAAHAPVTPQPTKQAAAPPPSSTLL